jgi:hypothetical protein
MDFEAVWGEGSLGCASLSTSDDGVRHADCNPEDARVSVAIARPRWSGYCTHGNVLSGPRTRTM